MKKLLFALQLLFASVFVFAQEDIVTLARYALVIGNEDYDDYPVKNAVADAELIKTSLENKGFEVLFKKNLNSHEEKECFESFINFVNQNKKSVALIYYAGHGYTDGDINYLVPVDNGSIHDEEVLFEKSVSLNDVADRIYAASTIYIIDAGYDNPFRNTNTRALGIKGSLAAVKSRKESTTVFMFSSMPHTPVLEPQNKNSLFASELSKQIDYSSKEVSELFADVRSSVESLTYGQQVPYVSSTGLTFAFGGEQYNRYMRTKQDSNLDSAKLLITLSTENLDEYNSSLQSIIDEKTRLGQEEKARLSEEMARQKAEQQEQDRLRALAEEEAARNRTAAENAEIERQKREFEELSKAFRKSSSLKISADERIDSIEQLKQTIWLLRQDVKYKIDSYNQDMDEEAREKITELTGRPYSLTETDSYGVPTKSALKRRENEREQIIKTRDEKKQAREKELLASIKNTDSKAVSRLNSLYSALESNTYETTSFSDELTVRILDFDGESGTWPLVITSSIFGYTTLFEYTIPLSYTEVTGKKYIPIDKMNAKQFAKYTETVQLYDSLFRSSTDVFYVKLNYKISRWMYASQYRFIPVKCEVVRLDKRNRTIHSEKSDSFSPKTFIMYPQTEVRTRTERDNDITKYNKILQKEKPAKSDYGAEGGLKMYNSERIDEDSTYDWNKKSEEKTPEPKPAKEKTPVLQRGRGGLNVYLVNDFGIDSALKNAGGFGDEISFQLLVPSSKFSYWGINAGFYNPKVNQFKYFDAGFDLGLNCRIGKFLRPYVQLTGNVDSSYNALAKFGGGVDFVIGISDFTVGYNYVLEYNYGRYFNKPSQYPSDSSKYQNIYIGAGFAW